MEYVTEAVTWSAVAMVGEILAFTFALLWLLLK